MTSEVAVVGGGIVGLTTALALRAIGLEVTVLERHSALRAEGSAITLWPEALHILDYYGGIGRRIEETAGPTDPIQVIDPDGNQINSFELSDIWAQTGRRAVCVQRQRLLALLAEALDPSALRFDSRVVSLDTSPSGRVNASFADGGVHEADIVIGADGIWSAARQAVAPGATPQFAQQIVWRGLLRIDHDPGVPTFTPPSRTDGVRGGWFMAGRGLLYWYVAQFNASDHTSPSVPLENAKMEALNLVGSWRHLAPFVAATPEPDVGRTEVFSLPPLERWTNGRIALIGDAAHALPPHLALGACLGIEDAYVLAQCAANSNGLADALLNYENQRRARASALHDQANAVAQLRGTEYGAAMKALQRHIATTGPLTGRPLDGSTHSSE